MKKHIEKWLVTAIVCSMFAGFNACGGGGGGGDAGTTSQQYQVSSAAGGDFVYTSPDNPNIMVSFSFAAGAVSTDTTITVDSSSAVYDSNVIPGLGFDFSPDGLAFSGTVTIVVTYDEAALGGADESELKIHKWTGSGWQELASVVEPAANTVTATLTGFSEYFVFPAAASAMQKLYFPADDGIHGWELWSWDGSALALEADTISGANSFGPGQIKAFNSKLYFVNNLNELWSYDGAQAAPVAVVTAANLGFIGNAGGSSTFGLLPFDNKLYFNAKTSSGRWELWSYSEASGLTMETDTSESTTYMPQGYMIHDGKIYFRGGEGSNNRELYVFDGTSAPNMVAEINSVDSSDPDWMTSFNGKLYFAADDGIHGRELWAYNSASDVATLVKDINPGSGDGIIIQITIDGANGFTPYNGKLYFAATSTAVSATSGALWTTDGTPEGTTEVATGFNGEVENLTVLDGKLYFYGIGNYGSTYHNGLWVYDTADVVNTPMPVPGFGQGQYDVITFDGRLYFKGWDPATGGFAGLVSSDGINEPVMEAYFSTNLIDSQYFSLSDSAAY